MLTVFAVNEGFIIFHLIVWLLMFLVLLDLFLVILPRSQISLTTLVSSDGRSYENKGQPVIYCSVPLKSNQAGCSVSLAHLLVSFRCGSLQKCALLIVMSQCTDTVWGTLLHHCSDPNHWSCYLVALKGSCVVSPWFCCSPLYYSRSQIALYVQIPLLTADKPWGFGALWHYQCI